MTPREKLLKLKQGFDRIKADNQKQLDIIWEDYVADKKDILYAEEAEIDKLLVDYFNGEYDPMKFALHYHLVRGDGIGMLVDNHLKKEN